MSLPFARLNACAATISATHCCSPCRALLVSQAVFRLELLRGGPRWNRVIAAVRAIHLEVLWVRIGVQLPVVLVHRVESSEPLLALHVAIVEDEVAHLSGGVRKD